MTVTVCYIAGPSGHEYEGLVVGIGAKNHPWGPGERGEVQVSLSCRFAVAEVESKDGLDSGSVAERAWMMTVDRQAVKLTPRAWRVEVPNG